MIILILLIIGLILAVTISPLVGLILIIIALALYAPFLALILLVVLLAIYLLAPASRGYYVVRRR